jgi:hypothetical protein
MTIMILVVFEINTLLKLSLNIIDNKTANSDSLLKKDLFGMKFN